MAVALLRMVGALQRRMCGRDGLSGTEEQRREIDAFMLLSWDVSRQRTKALWLAD